MSTADFYTHTNDTWTWLGSLAVDGEPASLGAAGVFAGNPRGPFNLPWWESVVADILREAVEQDRGYRPAEGDVWPWPYRDSGGTDYVYISNGHSVRVATGRRLLAEHYPGGVGVNGITNYPRMDGDS